MAKITLYDCSKGLDNDVISIIKEVECKEEDFDLVYVSLMVAYANHDKKSIVIENDDGTCWNPITIQ